MRTSKRTLAFLLLLLSTALSACGTASAVSSYNASAATRTAASITSAGQIIETSTIQSGQMGFSATYDQEDDGGWDSTQAQRITLAQGNIQYDGTSALIGQNTVTIAYEGTYVLTGSLTDGQIIVHCKKGGVVRLVLQNVDITCSNGPAIQVEKAAKVVLIAADGTQNKLSDGSSYALAADAEEPDATIYCKSDLTIAGAGALTISGNYRHAVHSADGLRITGGTILVSAVEDALRGRDFVAIRGGDLTVQAGEDGVKATNADEEGLGYLDITGGTLNIAAGQEGLQAVSAIVATGGALTINAGDDGLHSDNLVTLAGGTWQIACSDDGIHADAAITLSGAEVTIPQCYEGVESKVISIEHGTLRITAQDDGINVAGGKDSSAENGPDQGDDPFAVLSDAWLYIHGGLIVIDSQGDGLDSNGSIEMTGGTVIVNGPTADNNGAVDYNGSFSLSGGLLVAAGSTGMAQAPDASSPQNTVLIGLDATQPAGTLINISTDAGQSLLTFSAAKEYSSLVFSAPELRTGETYVVSTGGSAAGDETDGVYTATYTAGAEQARFTVQSPITTVGDGGRGPGRFGGGGGR